MGSVTYSYNNFNYNYMCLWLFVPEMEYLNLSIIKLMYMLVFLSHRLQSID